MEGGSGGVSRGEVQGSGGYAFETRRQWKILIALLPVDLEVCSNSFQKREK